MAKDAKGHGSEKRGGGMKLPPYSAVGPHSNLDAAKELSQGHGKSVTVPVSAHAPGRGGAFKVQSLNTSLAGQPFQTIKRFGNKTVAERTAMRMNTDERNKAPAQRGFLRVK